jgi:hypothetical protein
VLASCWLVGCNDRIAADGGGSGTDTDHETGAATGLDSTGEPPFVGVRRNTVVTFVAADGSVSTRSYDPTEDGTAWAVEVGDGAAIQSFPGEYDGVGWLEFAGVPEAPYVLRRTDAGGRSWLTVLDVRDIEADGVLRAGRSTALVAQTSTPRLSLSVSSMTALGEADALELYSRNVDALDSLGRYDGESPPALGATALDGWTLPWDAQNVVWQVPLVEPVAGDDLWLTHLVATPLFPELPPEEPDDAWREAQLLRLVEATALGLDQAIDDGATAAASGSFVAVTTTPVSLDLRLDQLREELEANLGSPGTVLGVSCVVRIVVAPGEDVPIEGMTPTLAEISVGNACSTVACEPETPPPGDRVVELEVGNPFDFGTELLQAGCWALGYVTHPETQLLEHVRAYLSFSRPLADVGPVAPTLGMPSDIHIGGEPCRMGDVLTGVGTTPTVSLAAPSLGTADHYAITVMRLEGPGAFGYGSPSRVGGFETTATTFTLPEGLLEPGAYYHLQVEARAGRQLGQARAYAHAQHVANATSGVFTP